MSELDPDNWSFTSLGGKTMVPLLDGDDPIVTIYIDPYGVQSVTPGNESNLTQITLSNGDEYVVIGTLEEVMGKLGIEIVNSYTTDSEQAALDRMKRLDGEAQ